MKKYFAIGLFLPLTVFALDGTGSVDFDSTVLPLLNQSPVLKELVLCDFDIVSDPMGTRIGGIQSKRLEGARIGPYSMWANWHGRSGIKPVVLTVNTRTTFFDAQGREVDSGLHSAVRVEEKIDSVTVEPPESGQPEVVPGGLKHAIDPKTCREQPGS